MRSSIDETETCRTEERRSEARYTLILRAGLLEQAGRVSFCLVKNISSKGVQLKVYSKPTLGAGATLQVADEPPVTGRISWVNGDAAGMSLTEALDAAALLRVRQKLQPSKRRAFPRMSIEATALLRSGGRVLRATLHDVSSLGARLSTNGDLKEGDRTIVELDGLPAIGAYVRWLGRCELGLAFETPIPMQILGDWIHRRRAAAGGRLPRVSP